MFGPLFRFFPRLPRPNRSNRLSGFTLIELLIAIFISGIIVSVLLSIVVELLQINQRETSRTEAQQEMQLALDYIGNELRSAVYIYDGECLQGNSSPATASEYCPGIRKYIPTVANGYPVIAFWKLDPLPAAVQEICKTGGTAAASIPCTAGRSYTLVAYYLIDNAPNDVWRGQARIARYELPRYNSSGQENKGYAIPLAQTTFRSWPMGIGNDASKDMRNGTTPPQRLVTLADFVSSNPLPNGVTPSCPTNYTLTPSVAATGNRNFYTCVTTSGDVGNRNQSRTQNQSVMLYLKGNAKGKPGILGDYELSALETRILGRAVIDKTRQ